MVQFLLKININIIIFPTGNRLSHKLSLVSRSFLSVGIVRAEGVPRGHVYILLRPSYIHTIMASCVKPTRYYYVIGMECITRWSMVRVLQSPRPLLLPTRRLVAPGAQVQIHSRRHRKPKGFPNTYTGNNLIHRRTNKQYNQMLFLHTHIHIDSNITITVCFSEPNIFSTLLFFRQR